jgi:hypothetical protein
MTKLTPFPSSDAALPLEAGEFAAERRSSERERKSEPLPSLDAIIEGVLLQLIHGRRARPGRAAQAG